MGVCAHGLPARNRRQGLTILVVQSSSKKLDFNWDSDGDIGRT